jgi:hypothetical protein
MEDGNWKTENGEAAADGLGPRDVNPREKASPLKR